MAYRKRGFKKSRRIVRAGVMRRTGLSATVKRMNVGYRSKKGFLALVRRCPEVSFRNGATTGTVSTPLPSTEQLQVGTPVLNNMGLYDIPFSIRFRLDNLVNSVDITALCDKYKLGGAYVRIFYTAVPGFGGTETASMNGLATLHNMPAIQYVTDHDDAELPNPVSFNEKMGLKYHTFKNINSYIAIKCRPVPAREIFNNGVTTAYEVPNRAPFIDSTKSAVEHYGIKGILKNVFLPPGVGGTGVGGMNGFRFDIALKVYGKDFQ